MTVLEAARPVAPAQEAEPGAPSAPRHALAVATGFAIAAASLVMASLLGAYLSAAGAADVWPPQGVVVPNVALLATYASLLLASLTAQWTLAALSSADRRHMYLAVGLTLVFGGAFVNGMTFSWAQLELVAGSSAYADAVYAVTVTHLLLVVSAMLVSVVVGFRALAGQDSTRHRELVACATAWWHFVVAAGSVVWFVVWFLEREL